MSFDWWCHSLQVDRTYGNLREVILMEEFNNSISLDIRTHITGHKVGELKGDAMSANDYELTHKRSIGLPRYGTTWYNKKEVSEDQSEEWKDHRGTSVRPSPGRQVEWSTKASRRGTIPMLLL